MLDKSGLPLNRLWCLYEVAQTQALNEGRLQMLPAPGVDLEDIEDIFVNVDIENAQCFDPNAERTIRANIIETFSNQRACSEKLKLLLADVLIKRRREQRSTTTSTQ